MGEDLALPGRDAIRTPMQWDARDGAGFSRADADKLVRPLVDDGEFGYPERERRRPALPTGTACSPGCSG